MSARRRAVGADRNDISLSATRLSQAYTEICRFPNPWWKVLAIIVAIIAAIVAIVAAALGAGTASFGVSGSFDETEPSVSCCTPDAEAAPEVEWTVAGVASLMAMGAVAVALSDAANPFWRRRGKRRRLRVS